MQPIALNDLARHTAPLRDELLAAMARVCDRGWYVLGPEVDAFEREFAAHTGVAHAVGVANGTEAIELAARALGVGPGDEVILAANAGMYSTTALRAVGATPVFVDVNEGDLTIDPGAVEGAITAKTRAIIATHLYGRIADVRRLRALADERGVALLEDCAQAHGARAGGQQAGAWGDAASFSFYPTKNLGALGDGGLVACRDGAVAARVRRLRQYGWESKYVAVEGPARNSRLDELQAAVLRVKLPHLDRWNARRRQVAAAYARVENPSLRHPDVEGDGYVAHLYVVRTQARDALRRHLAARQIGADIHYPLLDTQQPVLRGTAAPALPVSEAAACQVLSLPCYPELSDAEVARVCEALASFRP